MSAIFDDAEPQQPPKPKPRAKRTGHGHVPRRTRARVKPPASVTPGWVHELLAAITLRTIESRGVNPGALGDDFLAHIPGAEDGPEPAVLLARVYAHLAWRVPGLRVIAKRFEGREARAGLGSDLLALAVQLWVRNRDLLDGFRAEQARAREVDDELRRRRAADTTAATILDRIRRKRQAVAPDAPESTNATDPPSQEGTRP